MSDLQRKILRELAEEAVDRGDFADVIDAVKALASSSNAAKSVFDAFTKDLSSSKHFTTTKTATGLAITPKSAATVGFRTTARVKLYRRGDEPTFAYPKRPTKIAALADAVIEAGGEFTAENLSTGAMSIACETATGDIAGALVVPTGLRRSAEMNGALDKVVREAYAILIADGGFVREEPPPPPTEREALLPNFGGWRKAKGFA